ncbi:MAG: chemotaxis protein CheA [Pseudomonadota bacterium]
MDDLLADFVAETREMLEASEGEIIAWEADPSDSSRIDAIFRFVHTVKGNCGFFDFPRLADLSHAAEDALADVRAGRREADAALVTASLAVIDRIVELVNEIEASGVCPQGDDSALIAALEEGAEVDVAGVDNADNASETIADESEGTDPSSAPTPSSAIQAQRTIRLPVELLDRVMSGVSDMVLARNDLAHRLRQAGNQPTIDGPFERLTSILTDVRDAITRMRMQRIETLFSAVPRLARDLSAELGKQVFVNLEGGDVELDREMIEMVRDPLTHLIRNAIDHGIEAPHDRLANGKREAGTLSITARQSGNKISIVITDDGRGVDEKVIAAKAVATGLITQEQSESFGREKILQLIFEPGFSTAAEVSAISGRGVGLDVVRENLERVGGSIRVTSTTGTGTLFYLQIPLTLAIISGLTLEVGAQRFAIPQSYVEEVINISGDAANVTKVGETQLIDFRGVRTPCLKLSQVLGVDPEPGDSEKTMVLVRLASSDIFALEVDRIHAISDLVVKPLPRSIMDTNLYGGSTLLDDGQPILVLDLPQIALNAGLVSETRISSKTVEEDTHALIASGSLRAMLFTDFEGRRRAVRLELVQRIETAPANAIDRSGASPHAVIDGMILPLIGLPEGPLPAPKIRLLRLTDGTSELLQAVREVDDAVALTEELKPISDDPMIEAVTLVDGRTVSLIDAHEVFARHGDIPKPANQPLCRLPDSDWARTILAPLVTAAGYEIAQGNDADDHGDGSLSIWFEDEFEAAQALDWQMVGPVIRLRDQPESHEGCETIYRYDREGLIDALNKARAAAAKSIDPAELNDKGEAA